jgi:conjugal transfer ATP-binding protein TraC
MSDTAQKSVLLELVSKNYTGDSQGHEKLLRDEVAVPESSAFASPMVEPVPVSAMSPLVTEASAEATATNMAVSVDDPKKKLTKQEERELRQGEKEYYEALAYIKDAIAPAMMKVDAKQIQIGDTVIRSVFTYAYPDFLEGNWLSPLINWDVKFDMSMFIYPIEGAFVMKFLKKRLTELYSERSINMDKGLLNDPAIDAQIQDVEELRGSLTRGQERYFHFSIYVTMYGDGEEAIKKINNTFDNLLSGRNILTKQAFLRTEQAFIATGPFCKDEVGVYRNISTKGLSTTFPFTSASLSQDDGILYGVNTHNNSLIIFDRFRTENANMVVFAKSG